MHQPLEKQTVTPVVENRRVMRFELLMDAGFGAQKAGEILIRAFAAAGVYVYSEPVIPAEISPPRRTPAALSGAIIRVADFKIGNIGNHTDLILAAHEILLETRLDDGETGPGCRILLDVGLCKSNAESYQRVIDQVNERGYDLVEFEIDETSAMLIKSLNSGTNLYYLGILTCVYNLKCELVEPEIRKVFCKLPGDKLSKNITLFYNGYDYADTHIDYRTGIAMAHSREDQILIDGNSALSAGIVDAGITFMSGYPITPASTVMHTLAQDFAAYGGIVHQAEDEIAAIGAVIGAYYGGTPSITCTSGPGLSLKQEFIGYAAMAEIPLIVIDAQRSGPSTGMPTKTAQSDLPAVVFGRHGDNTTIVLSVADVDDCFYAPHVARYLTEKLKIPVIIMTDFQIASSFEVVHKMAVAEMEAADNIPDHVLQRFHIERLPETIEMVKDNQAIPGAPDGMRRVSGLNTDASGEIAYSPASAQRSHEIRNRKLHAVRYALQEPEIFGPPDADLLVVGWGSARDVIHEAVSVAQSRKLSAAGLHLKIVYPLPLMLADIFARHKKVVTVELAYGDALKPAPLASLLRMETAMDITSAICPATGRPLTPRSVLMKIQEYLCEHDL
ncbi:MAG: 2-oxoacid:acceptor oxidoreductase family protein [Lentisphaeria bacterium]|jgi:2-oxoglutarate ferredoxin oxidoreductase subunit alpha|nr:2-oxoacid:acceptor oxidoreductase family protein [Lentisphaeria bacterium]MDP7740362.1 2-oxoacid:acceptor oxidoreductase family protein [Lentisphaeria bacterium]